MSTPIWITIAAITLPLISSWIQFLLKEHREKKKALATANPATNQPNPDKPPIDTRMKSRSFFRRYGLFAIALWALSASALELGVSMLFGSITTNFNNCAGVYLFLDFFDLSYDPVFSS